MWSLLAHRQDLWNRIDEARWVLNRSFHQLFCFRNSASYIFASVCFFAAFAASASSYDQSRELPLSTEDVAGQLKDGYGYLLINLEVGGTAPSFTLKRSSGRKWKVSLKEKEPGLYVAPLREGEYQITRVDAPYFSLPFYIQTEDVDSWKFVIEEHSLSYLGKLHIDRERSVNFVNIRLLNRIAADMADIQARFPGLLAQYPLIHKPGYRDDFYRDVVALEER